ncbi:MAG: hypothetical protein MR902_00535 [Campylobacter sp.]|nr:hypothetical protein [Campylobacter sp.]
MSYALKRFSKDEILVVGYSIGSGIAAKISSENELKLLLVAPYESLEILAKEMVKIAQNF